MLLSHRMLVGPVVAVAQPPVSDAQRFSRKRRRFVSIKRDDLISWEASPDFGGDRELRFRSPLDPDQWLTKEGLDALVAKHLKDGGAFANRKGNALVEKANGLSGWLRPTNSKRREYHICDGQRWIPAAVPRDRSI